ncbi:energy transducer TonB [Pseudoalteromonas haloplanktis]|uniref:Protein TonB n=1 Tax=Pseudoalteromonas haloplanktis TaxID=228 RepID=A0ABU1B6L6_PSEHA|nr:energy transducer TonB [Pseudoalteromonas haloplanktis]MDQ9090214.1 energy transducer TonB [Pseudoalteromonas haloplanktis]
MIKKYSLGGLALLLVSTLTVAKTIYADVQVTPLKPLKNHTVWVRANQNTPKYPIALAKSGVRGCVVYSFDVDQHGDMNNIELMAAVPSRGLAKETKKLLKSWHWQVAEGQQAALEHKVIRLDFCIGGDSEEQAQQQCIAQSQLACSLSD